MPFPYRTGFVLFRLKLIQAITVYRCQTMVNKNQPVQLSYVLTRIINAGIITSMKLLQFNSMLGKKKQIKCFNLIPNAE